MNFLHQKYLLCKPPFIASFFILLFTIYLYHQTNAHQHLSADNHKAKRFRYFSSKLSEDNEELVKKKINKSFAKFENFSKANSSSSLFQVQVTAIHVDKAEFPLPKLLFKLALSVAEKSLESKRIKLLLNVRSANTCSSQYAGAIAAEEYYLKKARLFIVSGCDDAIRGVSRLASGWKVPVMTAAGFGADLNDKRIHQTLIRVAFSLKTAVKFLIKILKSFAWRRVNLIVDESDPNSFSLKEAIERHLLDSNELQINTISLDLQSLITSDSIGNNTINITNSSETISAIGNSSFSNPVKLNLKQSQQSSSSKIVEYPNEDKWPNEATDRAVREGLRQSSLFSRVNILLIPQNYLRKFMLSMYDQNMANGMYTFINIPLLLLASSQQSDAATISDQASQRGLVENKQSYTSSTGENIFLWRSLKSTRNAHSRQAFESLMSIYLRNPTTKAYVYFTGKVLSLANSDYATTTLSPIEANYMRNNLSQSTSAARLQLNVNPYAASFHDCLKIYARALEESLLYIDRDLNTTDDSHNVTLSKGSLDKKTTFRELHSRVVDFIKKRKFENMATGSILINENGDRDTDYTLDDLNPMTGKFSPVILYKGQSKEIERIGRIHWSSDEQIGPTIDNIDCALINSCPINPWSKFVVTLVIISAPLSVIVGLILYYVYSRISLESQLVDYWWKLSYKDIELVETRRRGSWRGNNSQTSLSTFTRGKTARDIGPTNRSGSIDKGASESEMSDLNANNNHYNKPISTVTKTTDLTGIDFCYGDIKLGIYKLNKVALKPISKFNQSRKLMIELRTIKTISHSNLCRFLGVVLETDPTMALVTEFCPKGSLREFFQNESLVIDWTFKCSIINDILAGLMYIHSSPLKAHGRLKSSNCLVSSRFVVKLSDYGLKSLYEQLDEDCDESILMEKKIWLAPEHMRSSSTGSKSATPKGDVYSFGLLLYEILTNKIPFQTVKFETESDFPKEQQKTINTQEPTESGAEFKYRMPLKALLSELKANGPSSDKTGPDLSLLGESFEDQKVVTQLVDLMKRSWIYEPNERLSMQEVQAILRRITRGVTSKKLLENLTSRMEQYTNNLESLVEAKLATLVDEKLKTEELLYQFVPKSVALRLKDNQSVEPEAFDCVTVFYSDIVGFTSLSSESSPMEVIDFLSELYLCFDETLEQYDIFKVDTIGDAYILASGLPQRNDRKHVIEIARAALELQQRISSFKIAHKPGRKLEMRVGINSGPCVAGIVGGLNMPKYCLFGDTLAVGKFMESSGLPMKIHVTEESKVLLDQIGGFTLEARVPKISKDGLPMQTYWLVNEALK